MTTEVTDHCFIDRQLVMKDPPLFEILIEQRHELPFCLLYQCYCCQSDGYTFLYLRSDSWTLTQRQVEHENLHRGPNTVSLGATYGIH
jgi:hypothetical protein